MTDHHVRSLRLHLRSQGTPPADVQTEARTFSERLLTAITERLDARANGRLVLLRRLPIRIRARRELFADRDELERIADDVAASIPLPETTTTTAEQDDVAIFADELHWRAAYLIEVATERAPTAWWFASLAADSDGIAGLTQLSRSNVEHVLRHVAHAGALSTLLARLSLAAVEQVATLLDVAPRSDATATPPAAAVAPRTHDELVRSIIARVASDARPAVSALSPTAREPAVTPPQSIADATDATLHRTRHGGLVYVMGCLLELDAGEILWRACVQEQIVIAAALASIADDHDDPAPALLGGASPRERFDVSPAQRDEIITALTASFAAALPRRGLAADPEISLHFIDGGAATRMIGAFIDAWPIFAVPAPTIADATAALDTLTRLFPSARFVASAQIAELHARVEIRAIERMPPSRRDLTTDAALVVAVVAGCAAALVHARSGEVIAPTDGRIHDDDDDRRIVTMPMDAISIGIRRAGLDRDPGWIPWLQRHVAIAFE